jgi:collagen type VI alpha
MMSEYDNKEDIKHKIENVRYQGGRTNTGDALHYVRTHVFPASGGRPNVPHIAIVLTDGMSQNFDYTTQEAAAAHAQGITTFVIGIGNKVLCTLM